MKEFVVYRGDLFDYNKLFVVVANSGEEAMQKVCDMLNRKYAVYEDFESPAVDYNGCPEPYNPKDDRFHYQEICFESGSDILQIKQEV